MSTDGQTLNHVFFTAETLIDVSQTSMALARDAPISIFRADHRLPITKIMIGRLPITEWQGNGNLVSII